MHLQAAGLHRLVHTLSLLCRYFQAQRRSTCARRRHRWPCVAAATLAAMLAVAGCGLGPRTITVPAPSGQLANWNPLLEPEPRLAALLYRGLVLVDATGRPEPDLARGWIVQDEGRTWIFPLRAGLRFSTGAPVRAADAVSVLRALADPAFGAPSGRLWWGRRVDALAGGTAVRVRLPWPDPALLWEVAAVPIIPSVWTRARSGGPPPGGGPYVVRSRRADGVDLAPNPLDGGAPTAARARAAVRLAWSAGAPARPSPGRDVFLLIFNTRRNPWSAVAVRRDWVDDIDRRAVARSARGRIVGGLFPPGTWAASAGQVFAAPRARLAGAAVLLYPAARRGAADAAATLAAGWARAGATVRAQPADTAALLQALMAPNDFDLLLTDWPFGPDLEAGPLLQGGASLNASGWNSPQGDALLAAMDGACPPMPVPSKLVAAGEGAGPPAPDLGYRVPPQLACAGDLARRAAAAAALNRLVSTEVPVVPLYTPREE